MGLDASVYCDCVETGRLHTPHPLPHLLFIADDEPYWQQFLNHLEELIHASLLVNKPIAF